MPASRAPLCARLLLACLSILSTVRCDEAKPKQSAVFIHIAKTAGSSFATDLRRLGVNIHGSESCSSRFKSMANEKRYFPYPQAVINLTILREPRAHTLSQFMMCAYKSPWILEMDRPAFLNPDSFQSINAGFSGWLRHFANDSWTFDTGDRPLDLASLYADDWEKRMVDGRSLYVQRSTGQVAVRPPFRDEHAALSTAFNRFGDFDCYTPRNHMTRQLSARCAGSPHHVYAESEEEGEEQLRSALQVLASLRVAGVAELYSLSVCLALHAAEAPSLPDFCFSDAAEQHLMHENHRVPKHSQSDVADDTWAVADGLTRLDVRLYEAGKAKLLAQFEDYQRAAAAEGRPLLGAHLKREKASRLHRSLRR
jgi:hypothetical protein